MSTDSVFEETEDLSEYEDETYEDLDPEGLEYEGSIEFDEAWDQIDEVDDYEFVEDES